MNDGLTIAILAAGAASRFGGGKLDAMFKGKPLGQFALETAARITRPCLIVGECAPDFALHAQVANMADMVANSRSGGGISTSIALATRIAEQRGSDKLLLALADMPLVESETLQWLVRNCEPGHPSAVIHPEGYPGIPACFPRDWFARLQGITGDRGAASILRNSDGVNLLPVEPCQLLDVDRPADIADLGELGEPPN